MTRQANESFIWTQCEFFPFVFYFRKDGTELQWAESSLNLVKYSKLIFIHRFVTFFFLSGGWTK